MSAEGLAAVRSREPKSEDERIDVTETSLAWVRSFVRERDVHFERVGGRTYLLLD